MNTSTSKDVIKKQFVIKGIFLKKDGSGFLSTMSQDELLLENPDETNIQDYADSLVEVSEHYMGNHNPQVGGMYLEKADGTCGYLE